MNRLANWMMRLYPADWRARYGDELRALLDDTGADARIVSDLFKGGMRMQMKVWRFLKLAAALTVLGTLLGIGVGRLIPPVYTSHATLQVTPAVLTDEDLQGNVSSRLNEKVMRLQQGVLSRTTLAGIIHDPRIQLYRDRLSTEPLEDVIQGMKRDTDVRLITLPGMLAKRATAFDITFTYSDPRKAQLAVRALTNAFDVQNMASQREPDRIGTPMILDAPSTPDALHPEWVAFFSGNSYLSVATVRFPGASRESVMQLQTEALSRASLSEIINDPQLRLYSAQLKTRSLEDVIDVMRKRIQVNDVTLPPNIAPAGAAVTISFEYEARDVTQQALWAIVDSFRAAARRMSNESLAEVDPAVKIDILDTASFPESPSKPNRNVIAAIGGIGGFLIAAVVALVRQRWKTAEHVPFEASLG